MGKVCFYVLRKRNMVRIWFILSAILCFASCVFFAFSPDGDRLVKLLVKLVIKNEEEKEKWLSIIPAVGMLGFAVIWGIIYFALIRKCRDGCPSTCLPKKFRETFEKIFGVVAQLVVGIGFPMASAEMGANFKSKNTVVAACLLTTAIICTLMALYTWTFQTLRRQAEEGQPEQLGGEREEPQPPQQLRVVVQGERPQQLQVVVQGEGGDARTERGGMEEVEMRQTGQEPAADTHTQRGEASSSRQPPAQAGHPAEIQEEKPQQEERVQVGGDDGQPEQQPEIEQVGGGGGREQQERAEVAEIQEEMPQPEERLQVAGGDGQRGQRPEIERGGGGREQQEREAAAELPLIDDFGFMDVLVALGLGILVQYKDTKPGFLILVAVPGAFKILMPVLFNNAWNYGERRDNRRRAAVRA